jgi:hypothetical protein
MGSFNYAPLFNEETMNVHSPFDNHHSSLKDPPMNYFWSINERWTTVTGQFRTTNELYLFRHWTIHNHHSTIQDSHSFVSLRHSTVRGLELTVTLFVPLHPFTLPNSSFSTLRCSLCRFIYAQLHHCQNLGIPSKSIFYECTRKTAARHSRKWFFATFVGQYFSSVSTHIGFSWLSRIRFSLLCFAAPFHPGESGDL